MGPDGQTVAIGETQMSDPMAEFEEQFPQSDVTQILEKNAA